MLSQLFYFINMASCVVIFLELLFTLKQNTFLKLCFLFIIASLFTMNYFSYMGVATRLQVLVVKTTRLIYVCSALLSIIYLVSPRIPRWIIWFTVVAASAITGLRISHFNQIDIETLAHHPNQVFSIGMELYVPIIGIRYFVFLLGTTAVLIAFYYYRLLLAKIDRGLPNYKQLLWWIVSFVTPFFLLLIFSVLGNVGILEQDFSIYLFSFFTCAILLSILLRPESLNTHQYLEKSSQDPAVGYNLNS